MTDRPIIYSTPMVVALLENRKTMTRRLAWRMDCGKRVEWSASIWQRVVPGDRLWVRENFARNENQLSDDRMDRSMVYAADAKGRALDNGSPKPWTPSIHMPRRASRLTLVVTATKIEPLREISEKDATAEGVFYDSANPDTMRGRFRDLWIRLHGEEAWDANPEVVAVTFTVHKANIDAMPREAAA